MQARGIILRARRLPDFDFVELAGDRVRLGGEAVTVLRGELV